MTLPKPVEKALYDEWEGEVAIEGYNDGKYGRSYVGTIEGEETWINPGKQLKVELAKGNIYKIKMSRKFGRKGWYVSDAELISGDASPSPVVKTPTKEVVTETKPNTVESVKKVTSLVNDRMSKEDWAKKDLGIKWLACVKASAIFNAHRPDVDILKVLKDANTLYNVNGQECECKVGETPSDTEGLIE